MVGGRMELVRFQGEDRGVWHTRHILVQGHISVLYFFFNFDFLVLRYRIKPSIVGGIGEREKRHIPRMKSSPTIPILF